MDYEISHVLLGLAGVIFARKVWNFFESKEQEDKSLMGKPVEMREVDATSLGGPTIQPIGPYARL